jgi:biotin transport system substrate-specific component
MTLMTNPSLACYDTLIKPAARWLEIPILLAFNLVLVASAYVAFNLPFSPVPVTAQTLAVLLVAMCLGKVRATAVVAAYLAEGAAGLPVFAGGKAGLIAFAGPTGGYLLGFLAAAWVIGALSDRGWHISYFKSIAAMVLGTATIFACGLAWLAIMVPAVSATAIGLYPFLPGAAVKVAVAAAVLPTITRFMRR